MGALTSFVMFSLAFCKCAQTGAPFIEPPTYRSEHTTLTFAEYTMQGPDGFTQLTRSFDGMFGGPTLRVQPGSTLYLTVHNQLTPEKVSTSGSTNGILRIDSTNIHTHGLHISPLSPGDDMFTKIGPGTSYEYIFEIPKDHMPGTHWYHPHFHGSTALHTGGGAAGFLIVDDPPGYLPPAIENLEEFLLVITHLNSQLMKLYSSMYEQNCKVLGGSDLDCHDKFWASGPLNGAPIDTLLVNGLQEPRLEIVANRWYRLRLLFSSIDVAISPVISGCTTKLLAKDGVYLHQAPRDLVRGFMGPGNRADWLINCPPGTWQLESKLREGDSLKFHFEAQLLTIVAADQGEVACALPTFSVSRPCYLVDLTHAEATSSLNWVLGPTPYLNNKVFEHEEHEVAACVELGRVVDLDVIGIDEHPFHIHINPFQLTNELSDSYDGYFAAGDWHDTLFTVGHRAQARMITDHFGGEMVVHCHFLAHEDFGMMHLIRLEGEEGTHYPKSKEIDRQCFWDDETFGPPTIIQHGEEQAVCDDQACCSSTAPTQPAAKDNSPKPKAASTEGDDLPYEYLLLALIWLLIPGSILVIGLAVLLKRLAQAWLQRRSSPSIQPSVPPARSPARSSTRRPPFMLGRAKSNALDRQPLTSSRRSDSPKHRGRGMPKSTSAPKRLSEIASPRALRPSTPREGSLSGSWNEDVESGLGPSKTLTLSSCQRV
uniref:Plastocyanin-like domain-containing protein n=1 Tax=Chrysotila carterae TaxID=13221 RepID=A0A7S4F7G8_CHRCT